MSLMMSKGLEGVVDLDSQSGQKTITKGIKAELTFSDGEKFQVSFLGFGIDNAAATKNIVLGVDSSLFKHIYCQANLSYFDAFDNQIDLSNLINFSVDRSHSGNTEYFATLILEIEL